MVRTHYGVGLKDVAKRDGKLLNSELNPQDYSRDRGCPGISKSCLACSLAMCIEDYPPQERAAVRRQFMERRLSSEQSR
jgi:hypothetical protein